MNLTGAIGGRPAERNLEKMLEEMNDPKMASKVIKTIADFNTALNQIKFIPRFSFQRRYLDMQYRATKNKITNMQFPEQVKSHAMNSIIAEHRNFVKSLQKQEVENPQERKKSRPEEY